MKTLLTLLISLFFGLTSYGTAQAPDKIIYDGKEYDLFSNPLESYFEKYPDKRPQSGVVSTGLWRGYVATFTIIDSQLYLTDIEIEIFDTTSNEIFETKWESVLNEVFPNTKKIESQLVYRIDCNSSWRISKLCSYGIWFDLQKLHFARN